MMQENTRKKLELIADKALMMSEWGFAEHIRLRGMKNSVSWSADRPLGQSVQVDHRDMPTREQIAATLLLVRFFTQSNEGICLFRNDWIEPKANYRSPDWLNDPSLSVMWRRHYDDNQRLLNDYLAAYDRSQYANVDERIVTHGMLFEAYSYGYALHTTETPGKLLDRLNKTMFGIEEYEYEFCIVLLNIILIIQRMAWVTRMELAGEPPPNPWPADTRWEKVFGYHYNAEPGEDKE